MPPGAPGPWIRLRAPRTWKLPNRLPWRLYVELRGTWPPDYVELMLSVNGHPHITMAGEPGSFRIYQVPLRWSRQFYDAQAAYQIEHGLPIDGMVELLVQVRTLEGKTIASSSFTVRLICLPCLGV